MSVLIKDMSIPKDKELLLRIDEKGQVYIYGEYPTKIYKAIELQPHGDLIDRDKASERFAELSKNIEAKVGFENSAHYTLASLFLQNKSEFPAIIEAEVT